MQNVKAARALNVTAARGKKKRRSPTVHRYNGNGNFFMTPTVRASFSMPFLRLYDNRIVARSERWTML